MVTCVPGVPGTGETSSGLHTSVTHRVFCFVSVLILHNVPFVCAFYSGSAGVAQSSVQRTGPLLEMLILLWTGTPLPCISATRPPRRG